MDHPYLLIAVTSLVCGLAAGHVMYRSDFCVAAACRDIFLFRDYFMARMLLLVVVVSALLFEAARLAGLLAYYPFPLLGPPTLAALAGGIVFGLGMVLAGGCVVGTLYKMGAGHLASAVAFVAMLAGSALYAEIHPAWAAFAGATVLSPAKTLPQWLATAPTVPVLLAATAGGLFLYRQQRRGALVRRSAAIGHLQPWKAALVIALLGIVSYVLVGMPLGITTAYSKLGASLEALVVPDHVSALAYFSAQPLDYRPPFAGQAIRGGPGPGFDGIAAIQYPLIVGIVGGALLSARRLGEFRLHWRVPGRQLASAALGGLLLGLAARLVPSCNLWHLWGGLPILALSSLLFLLGLLPGAWLGSRLLTRWVIR
jgi:hypothetical protein